jgi:hypothetical protein
MLKNEGGIGNGEAVLKLTPAVRAEIENRAFNEGIQMAADLARSVGAICPDSRKVAALYEFADAVERVKRVVAD